MVKGEKRPLLQSILDHCPIWAGVSHRWAQLKFLDFSGTHIKSGWWSSQHCPKVCHRHGPLAARWQDVQYINAYIREQRGQSRRASRRRRHLLNHRLHHPIPQPFASFPTGVLAIYE